jgi:hypothetical protein
MNAEETTQAAHRSSVGRVLDFVTDHPKTSLVVGAGVSLVAGAEILAAGLFGGAVALLFGGREARQHNGQPHG